MGETLIRLPPDGLVAIVDDEDAERVLKFKWHTSSRFGRSYVRRYVDRVRGGVRRRRVILLHRFILMAPDGEQVDHANGNGLDNRRCNLRVCSGVQNIANRGPDLRPNRTSRFKGVRKRNYPYGLRWDATFRRKHLGTFLSEEEAARAYDAAIVAAGDEFAWMNFPPEGRVQASHRKLDWNSGDGGNSAGS